MTEAEVRIDVSDWWNDALHTEEMPQTEGDLAALAVREGYSARRAAQIAIAARVMSKSPEDILPDDKNLLGTGGASAVHMAIAIQKKQIEINGKEYRARQFTAVCPEEQEDEPEPDAEQQEFEQTVEPLERPPELPDHGYVKLGTDKSLENALRYLRRRVPGHVWNRLVEIKAAEGNVREAADELVARIYQMVGELE